MITKTKIKKVAAMAAIVAISATTLSGAYAATTKIGDATVTGNTVLNQDIMFDDATNKGTASVAGIKVTANIAATMNMIISADEIALGKLEAGKEKSGNLNIEVGTNAISGVNITARSTKGGLEHTDNAGVLINSTHTGESYKFSSAHTVDSTVTGFISDGDLAATEVVNNQDEMQIYNTNKPEITDGNDDVTFTVAATANAQSAFGEYEDTITFTVVGNF